MDPADRLVVRPVRRIAGRIAVPGDKSISHRALMLGAIADGVTRVGGFLNGDDCLATLAAFESLGIAIEARSPTSLVIHGKGLHGLSTPDGPLDFGNSGTAIRLMAGLLSGQPFDSVLTGDESLRRRPMERIAAPLVKMGAAITTRDGNAPLRITGGRRLRGIDYALPVASAQIKSAVLLAALYASGPTTLRSPGPSRDHTERMLAAMGVEVEWTPDAASLALNPPARLDACAIDVPGDFSSAAFFIVAGLLGADDGLVVEGVGVNPTRTGLLTVLRAMGARIELEAEREVGGEPVADIHVARSRLTGVTVPVELVPLMIDEFPALFVAAAAAEGRTVVDGAAELRHKESDRIAVAARALAALGGRAQERPAGLVVEGGGRLAGGTVDSEGDHRIAMAFAMASLLAERPITILNTAEVATSYPGFAAAARTAGLDLDALAEPGS